MLVKHTPGNNYLLLKLSSDQSNLVSIKIFRINRESAYKFVLAVKE